MTDEEEFEKVVRDRIAMAQQLTGYSFASLLKLIENEGAVAAARKLIYNLGVFPPGMRILFRAGLLDHTIEQAVIDFGRCGKLFTSAEVSRAEDRLQMLRLMFGK
jgi:hypothetical protein